MSESTTATIPQKVSLKICFTFFIGDGVSGNLFGSSDMALVGIGDTYNDAVFSAIRKINTNDKNLQRLILDGKKRIVEYYNTVSSSLIDEAKCCMRRLDYETALSKIYTIPSLCDKYDIAQKIIAECSRKLLERNNNNLLVKARTVWCSNPNFNGAKEASEYISQICVTSLSLKIEIDKLTNEMKTRLSQIDNKKLELERAEISSLEEIKKEQIATSAKLATSFWDALPKIVYHIFNWF